MISLKFLKSKCEVLYVRQYACIVIPDCPSIEKRCDVEAFRQEVDRERRKLEDERLERDKLEKEEERLKKEQEKEEDRKYMEQRMVSILV